MAEFLGRPVHTFPAGTRTAEDAAIAVGCDLAQIVKSLVFKRGDGSPLLVLVSGRNRMDEAKVEALVGQRVGKADRSFVREVTGYEVGGVPPAGHPQPIETLVDEDLMVFGELWAGAGAPMSMMRIAPEELVGLTNGRVADVAA